MDNKIPEQEIVHVRVCCMCIWFSFNGFNWDFVLLRWKAEAGETSGPWVACRAPAAAPWVLMMWWDGSGRRMLVCSWAFQEPTQTYCNGTHSQNLTSSSPAGWPWAPREWRPARQHWCRQFSPLGRSVWPGLELLPAPLWPLKRKSKSFKCNVPSYKC